MITRRQIDGQNIDGQNVDFEATHRMLPCIAGQNASESRQSQIIGDASEAFLIDLPPAEVAALSHKERGLVEFRNKTAKVLVTRKINCAKPSKP